MKSGARYWRILARSFVFILLTVLTQVGGLVYLLSLGIYGMAKNKIKTAYVRYTVKWGGFLMLYGITTFLIVPRIARSLGRVPLPHTTVSHVKPLNFLTCLLNRNYVRPPLRAAALEVGQAMNERYPGTVVQYLDAGFPFFNGFPLFPHLSHNDGKKLDLSFCYLDKETGEATNDCPSWIGYGICEEPLPGEVHTAEGCAEKGYWQYSFLKEVVPQSNKQYYLFDKVRTKELIHFFVLQQVINKIFLEPHLKTRLGLSGDKMRFHGCRAVRHDDHVHVELK